MLPQIFLQIFGHTKINTPFIRDFKSKRVKVGLSLQLGVGKNEDEGKLFKC